MWPSVANLGTYQSPTTVLCKRMKSRANELLDRAVAAMAAAVEIYNKPGFPYRTESFTILAINGWELLLKAKWLHLKRHNIRSLYVYDTRQTLAGNKSKRQYIRRRSSGTPFTIGMTKIASSLLESKVLDQEARTNPCHDG